MVVGKAKMKTFEWFFLKDRNDNDDGDGEMEKDYIKKVSTFCLYLYRVGDTQ